MPGKGGGGLGTVIKRFYSLVWNELCWVGRLTHERSGGGWTPDNHLCFARLSSRPLFDLGCDDWKCRPTDCVTSCGEKVINDAALLCFVFFFFWKKKKENLPNSTFWDEKRTVLKVRVQTRHSVGIIGPAWWPRQTFCVVFLANMVDPRGDRDLILFSFYLSEVPVSIF